jgi:hypothetical protein
VTRPRLIGTLSLVAVLLAVGAVVGVLRSRSEPRLSPLPRCARPAHTIPRPNELPSRFPLPPGTLYTGVDRKYPGSPVVMGRLPLDLGPASAFLARRLPAAGFTTSYGEREVGYEFESAYAGRGVSGRFKVRILFQCRGATRFWISAQTT